MEISEQLSQFALNRDAPLCNVFSGRGTGRYAGEAFSLNKEGFNG